jgi:hypothetical protein
MDVHQFLRTQIQEARKCPAYPQFFSVPGKCCGWGLGRVPFAFLEVHAFDETVRDGINVPHLAIRKNVASEALHQLANLDLSLTPFAVDHFDRFHTRIKLLRASPLFAIFKGWVSVK